MERWYIGFRTRNSPVDLTQNLGRLVRQNGLGDFITRACYERRSGHKRISEYYYFVGVVSDEKGLIPDEKYHALHNTFYQLGVRDSGIYVYYDEIQPMASKEIEAFNIRQIKMVQLDRYLPNDPFDFTAYAEDSPHSTEDTRPAFNQLLFCLSAYGRGTWQQFRTMCAELGIDSTGEYARRVSRSLRSLGHIELSRDGQNWFAAPSCLVQVESGDQQYHAFVAGQRSSRLLEMLQQETHIMTAAQPYGKAPEQVLVTFPNESAARAFTDDCSRQHHPIYLAGHAGLRMASILPSLDEWEVSQPMPSIVKGNYRFERWVDGDLESVPLPRETGMYRLTHNSERFEHPQLTLYYNADTDTWRRADWYGIRFLALRRTGTSCDVHYDSARRELAVALEQRWPDLYERSLVLASGRLPHFHNDHAIYSNITVAQAHILASKLGANLIEHGGT
jgi:hypothetical protein